MPTKSKNQEPTIEINLPQRKGGVAVLRPDQGLLGVWGNFWTAYENARARYAEVVQYIITNQLSRQRIFDTLITAGRPYNTATSYATYLSNLAKPRNAGVLKDLADGKITIEESRRYSSRRQESRLNLPDNRLALIERKYLEIAERAREFEIGLEACKEIALRTAEAVYARKWRTEEVAT